MKEKYTTPQMEIFSFESEDIITTSDYVNSETEQM